MVCRLCTVEAKTTPFSEAVPPVTFKLYMGVAKEDYMHLLYQVFAFG